MKDGTVQVEGASDDQYHTGLDDRNRSRVAECIVCKLLLRHRHLPLLGLYDPCPCCIAGSHTSAPFVCRRSRAPACEAGEANRVQHDDISCACRKTAAHRVPKWSRTEAGEHSAIVLQRAMVRLDQVITRRLHCFPQVGILTSPGEASHAVVFCHGYGSSKAGFHLPALADALAAVGVASLRFDFAGAASCMCAKEVTGDGPAAKCGSPKSNCEDWFNCCTSGNGESDGTFRLAGYWDEVSEIEPGLLVHSSWQPCPSMVRLFIFRVELALISQVEDIRCAVMLLREQERLNVCAILGHRCELWEGTLPRLQLWRVAWTAGHHDRGPVPARSKGGTDVILYASKYDGEPECECIINVCGRFFLATGIEERFGADIFERLKDEGPISMPHPSKNGPDWILTEEVRMVQRHRDVCAGIA